MSVQSFKPAYFTIDETVPVAVATVTRSSLSDEDNIEEFGVELNRLVDHFNCRWLALDLQNVNLITSAAVGKLIGLHRNLHRRDGQLTLCGIRGVTQSVFHSARRLDYFHVTPSVAEAIEQLIQAKTLTETSS